MESKTTTTPPAPDPLAVMFQNTTINNAEKSEFSNSARGNTVNDFTKEGENLVLESSDIIDFFRNVVQPFLAEVHKNDQSRSTVGDTVMASGDGSGPVSQAVTTDHTVKADPVDIVDLVASEPSSLPFASFADMYTRSMLKCLVGYPLYEPKPSNELSREYLRHGISIGDVGFVRGDGVFEFLFNVCPSKNGLIHPPNLLNGFSLDIADHSATRPARALPRKTCLFQSPVTRTKTGEYICEGSEGAILELPEGAIQEEATNILPFERLAARHGVQWYEYTMTQGRKISNGSLYLITSLAKCGQWGIAVFDRKCAPGEGLRFEKKRSLPFGKSTSKYHWKGEHAFHARVSDPDQGDTQNQCIFLRGYKIMIRQDIYDNLCQLCRSDPEMPSSSSRAGSINLTRQPATHIRGDGGYDPMSKRRTSRSFFSWTTMKEPNEAILHANINSSLVHPSDIINAALLNQNPDAKVALTHDDVWCDLLRDNFPKLNYMTLMNIARSYTNTVDEYDCVTLVNVLDESNCPLQATEIPAFQAPLTTPDDDYTPLPTMISVILPRELVERILLLLDTKSMLTCRLVNRRFNEIIQSSILLQCFLTCKAAGVIDNPESPLSYNERLEALKKREDAWRKLKPVFEMTISVLNDQTVRMYGTSEGFFFLRDDNRRDLNYCHLTLFSQHNPRWIRIPGHGPALNWSGIFVNFVTALHEHDLIVNMISSSDSGNQADVERHSLDFVLLKFSTGEYHPLARRPQIHVQRSPDVKPRVVSRIVGDNLALVVHSNNDTFPDKLWIFDWKTGRRLLQHEATKKAYFDLLFVSPELLLVPNCVISHFEVWHLPCQQLNPKPPIQILSLQIPTISPEYSLFEFRCYGEPHPFHAMPYLPPHPFLASPEDSIITVTLRMSSDSRRPASYNLIMHRRALLDTIQTWTSPSLVEQQEYRPMWLTNNVTVRQIADPEDGSVRLEAQSKLSSTVPHPRFSRTRDSRTFEISQTSRTFPAPHTSADSGSSSVSSGSCTNSSTYPCTFLRVPWAKWGPPISRWFQVNETQAQWIVVSNGQRYAFSEPNPLDERKLMVSVADFNPHNVRRNGEMIARLRSGGEDNGSNGNHKEGKEEELEILDHKGVFSEEVYMGSKCVVYRMPDEYDFDVVRIDEQRLFGVKLNRDGLEETIKVLYIG